MISSTTQRINPRKLLDLNYSETNDDVDGAMQIKENLTTMYQQMVSKVKSHQLFYGELYNVGDHPNPGEGNIKRITHNSIYS